jgi:serine/threonine protein kinase
VGGNYTLKSDVWSLGWVFYQIFAAVFDKFVLYDSVVLIHESFLQEIEENPQSLMLWMENVADKLESASDRRPTEWIKNMVHHDPDLRPTAYSLLRTISKDGPSFCGVCCGDKNVHAEVTFNMEGVSRDPSNLRGVPSSSAPPVFSFLDQGRRPKHDESQTLLEKDALVGCISRIYQHIDSRRLEKESEVGSGTKSQIPEIIVCGDTQSGKTSVLEALTQFPMRIHGLRKEKFVVE